MTTPNEQARKPAEDHDSVTGGIDPRTANVGFVYRETGGRVYFWYADGVSAVDDWDLREQYPDVSVDQWDEWFRAAFQRGESEFVDELVAHNPKLLETDEGRRALALGSLFGPGAPRSDPQDAHDTPDKSVAARPRGRETRGD